MDVADNIKQTLRYGSVILALDDKFFTPDQLLRWLFSKPITTIDENVTIIASYVALLKHLPFDQHYINNVHIIKSQIDLGIVALKMNYNMNIPIVKGEETTIIDYCQELWSRASSYYLLTSRVVDIALGITAENNPLQFHTQMLNINNVSLYQSQLNELSVFYHWFKHITYNSKLCRLILQEAKRIRQLAPAYYTRVLYKHLYLIATKLASQDLINLDKEEFHLFNNIFPQVVDQRLLNYDDTAFTLAMTDVNYAGYVLGLPIHLRVPTADEIHQSLHKYMILGLEDYAKHMRDHSQQPLVKFATDKKELKYVNSENIYYNNIDEYAPFDVVNYQTGEHVYRFTRNEFAHLLKTKKNYYTNLELPLQCLSTIQQRLTMAEEFGFPRAKPLKELLEQVLTGEEEEEDEEADEEGVVLASDWGLDADIVNYVQGLQNI